ncbi:MAG: hypothetical protein K9G64_05150 [Bacteroidia bacterium]|nr:hypothetical protein [Bacteroidia bacterium]
MRFINLNTTIFKPFFDKFQKINLSYFIIAIYLLFSFLFAFERILNIDCTFFFFNIVNYKIFFIPEYRYGIFLSQIPLLIAAKIGLSLNSLVYIYSLTFPFFYLFIIWVCNAVLKVKQVALVASLSLIAGVAFSFFHPVTETYHAIIFSTLFLGVIVSDETKKLNSFINILLIILIEIFALASHPTAVFTCSFIVIYCFINKEIDYKKGLFLLVFPILSIVLRLVLVDEKSYDSKQYDSLFFNLKSPANFLSLYPVNYLKDRMFQLYLMPIILIFSTIIFHLFKRKYLIISFTIIYSSVYLIILVLTFANGDGDVMMEKSFFPLLFMFIVPFTTIFFNSNYGIKLSGFIITSLLIMVSFIGIVYAGKKHTERLNILTETLSKTTYPKIIANYRDLDEPKVKFNQWGTGIETIILAKCKLNKSATIYLVDDKLKFEYNKNDSNLFLSVTWWSVWNINALDSNYFKVAKVPYHLY